MSGSYREALTDVKEWSLGLPGCPGVFGRTSRMSESGRETLPDVWELSEARQDVREWSKGNPVCPGVVGRLSRMSGSFREALLYVW